MASFAYNSGKVKLGNGSIDWDTDVIKMALVTNSYTPDKDVHDFWDDVSANEVASSGSYVASTTNGGVTLTCQVTQDNTNDVAVYDATDLSGGSAITGFTGTFRYLVFYKSTGVASTSPLMCVIDYNGASVSVVNGTISITWASGGIFNF